jgi:hypothetical protein
MDLMHFIRISRPSCHLHYIFDISIDIELTGASLKAHVPYFPENLAFLPCPVVQSADTPRNTRVAVMVPAIEFLPIVQIDCDT